jgi:hypothetical protein
VGLNEKGRSPGGIAVIAIIAISALTFEIGNSVYDIVHSHFEGRWWEFIVMGMTVLACGFAVIELAHRVKELADRKVLRVMVDWLFRASMVVGLGTIPYAFLFHNAWGLLWMVLACIPIVIFGNLQDSLRDAQITFDEWKDRKKFEAEEQERQRQIQRAHEEKLRHEQADPILKEFNRMSTQAKIRGGFT